ncbi:MAG: 4'-phosphopantetheinyl transferase family protein [Pseudoxanthomonas sp.]
MQGRTGIHVFLATPDALLQARGADAAMRLLDASDGAHVARFRFQKDRDIALASRALQRIAIAHAARLAEGAAAGLRFSDEAGARPFLLQPPALRNLHFSAANTRGMVACAVSSANLVGMDVEEVKPELAPELVEHCCTPAEKRELSRLPPDRQRLEFFRLWTLKESYLKARGIGLQLSPHLIGFDASATAGVFRLHAAPSVEPNPGHWHFQVLDAGSGHAASVCARDQTGIRPTITVLGVAWSGSGFELSSPP